LSSTCFEQPSVHLQEDLYMQFHGIFFMHQYKHSGRWQDVLSTYGCMKKYHKTVCKVFLKMNTWLFETCRRQYN